MALLRAAFPPLESEHFQHFCFLPVCHFQAQHFIGSSGEHCITVRFAFSCQDACEAVVLAEAKPKGLLSAAAAFSAPSPQGTLPLMVLHRFFHSPWKILISLISYYAAITR